MKGINKVISIILMVALLITFTVTADAVTVKTVATAKHKIIGQSDDIYKSSRIPNLLNINWVASATQVIISVHNTGIDTVDTFKGTVSVKSGTSKNFTALKLKPFETRQIKVNINMKKCYESITVSYYAIDGGKDFGKGSSPGHREIPSNLSNLWHKGTFKDIHSSINYHFNKHHSEVGANDIVTYATKAKNYRNTVVSDKGKLSNSQLKKKYTISKNSGKISANKYKSNSNYQFAILTTSGNNILSYGK